MLLLQTYSAVDCVSVRPQIGQIIKLQTDIFFLSLTEEEGLRLFSEEEVIMFFKNPHPYTGLSLRLTVGNRIMSNNRNNQCHVEFGMFHYRKIKLPHI